MGQFVIAFSFIVVVLQATTMLLHRPASSWSFSLVERPALVGSQDITEVLAAWNPHALLLTLSCIHLLMCVCKTQHNSELKRPDSQRTMPLGYGAALIVLLLLVVLILTGIKHINLVQYPTILTIIALLVALLWFLYNFEAYADDGLWQLGFHMRLVSVPLAVLSIATMGARLWPDVFTHIVLLAAAVNCLQLQKMHDAWALQICRLLTILLPTLSLMLARIQWGYSDNWLYAVAIMGCAGLLPLYVFTIVVPDGDTERNEKIRLRMAHLCTAGALLSIVVNLATFNKP